MAVNNPKYNYLVERVHQVIYNMLVTNDLDKKSLIIYIHVMKTYHLYHGR